jgi:hypothetical protein
MLRQKDGRFRHILPHGMNGLFNFVKIATEADPVCDSVNVNDVSGLRGVVLELTQYIANIGELEPLIGGDSACTYDDTWLIQILVGVRDVWRSPQDITYGFAVTVLKRNVDECRQPSRGIKVRTARRV